MRPILVPSAQTQSTCGRVPPVPPAVVLFPPRCSYPLPSHLPLAHLAAVHLLGADSACQRAMQGDIRHSQSDLRCCGAGPGRAGPRRVAVSRGPIRHDPRATLHHDVNERQREAAWIDGFDAGPGGAGRGESGAAVSACTTLNCSALAPKWRCRYNNNESLSR